MPDSLFCRKCGRSREQQPYQDGTHSQAQLSALKSLLRRQEAMNEREEQSKREVEQRQAESQKRRANAAKARLAKRLSRGQQVADEGVEKSKITPSSKPGKLNATSRKHTF